MNQNILHVGLDVDDTQYHGSDFNKATGEVIDFRCRPTHCAFSPFADFRGNLTTSAGSKATDVIDRY